jgi:hypothetical protein
MRGPFDGKNNNAGIILAWLALIVGAVYTLFMDAE